MKIKNKFNKSIQTVFPSRYFEYLDKLSNLKLKYIFIVIWINVSAPILITSIVYASKYFIKDSTSILVIIPLLIGLSIIAFHIIVWIIIDEYYDLKVDKLQHKYSDE